MAYMNQERKAKIVSAAKPVLAKYGMKATFRCNRSTITCTLKSGSIDFISEMAPQPTSAALPGTVTVIETEELRSRYHFDVNRYWFDEHYINATAKNFIGEIMSALRAADYYDRSDSSTDYTAYYYNLQVGDWNRPYDVTSTARHAGEIA